MSHVPGHRDVARVAVSDPSFREPIDAVGGIKAAAASLPFSAIGTAIAVASSVASWFLGKRDERDRLEKVLAEARLFDDGSDVSVSEPQYVVGIARTPGVAGTPIDSGRFSRLYADDSRLIIRNVHVPTLLSAGELANVEGMWVDGLEAPVVGTAQSRLFQTTGFLGLPPPNAPITWQLGVGQGGLYRKAQDIQSRMTALLPNWRPVKDTDPAVIPADADPVVVALFSDLVAEWNRFVNARRATWADLRSVKLVSGQNEGPANEPVVAAYLSFGTAADGRADSIVQTYAMSTTPSRSDVDEPGRTRATVAGWQATDLFSGLSWALVRHRFWLDRSAGQVLPRPSVPPVEWLLRGGGDFDGNAAKFAKFVLKLTGERSDADLDGLAPAVAYCEESLQVREMSLSDVGASDIPEGQLRWDTYREVLWPDGVPSDAVQGRVLAEVNLREAGAVNARRRYEINRVVRASEIESGEALARTGEVMGGYFVELAGRKVGFRPARPKSAVVNIVTDDMLEAPEWKMGVPGPNAFETVIAADHERDWRPSTLPRSQSAGLVARDGLNVQRRSAWGLVDNLSAMRQDAMLIDRDSVDKREAMLVVKVESASDPKGLLQPLDVVSIENAYGNVSRAEVQMVQPGFGQLALVVRELDADTYSDKYFPTPLDRAPGPVDPGGPGWSFSWGADFRQSATGRVCDVRLFLGEDVDQVEIEATWRERVASDPAVADVVQHYRFAVGADERGVWLVHTIVEQAATDPLTVVGADADVNLFEGDTNRELFLRITSRNAGVAGAAVEGLLVPGVTTGESPVTWQGVKATEVVVLNKFAGWLVQVYDVKALFGTLVMSWAGGGANGTDWATISTTTTDTVHVQDDPVRAGVKWLVIQNTFDLSATQNTLTLAARTGAGTNDDPYVYSAGVEIDLAKYVKPAGLVSIVSSEPTAATPGGYVGELRGTVE